MTGHAVYVLPTSL